MSFETAPSFGVRDPGMLPALLGVLVLVVLLLGVGAHVAALVAHP